MTQQSDKVSAYEFVDVSDPKQVPAEELRGVLALLLSELNMAVQRREGFYSEAHYNVYRRSND